MNTTERRQRQGALLLLLLGIVLRVAFPGEFPAGINQDEAFAGYEAFSMLTTGADSFGYANPSYLVTWGSGMSALQSYLAIPFISLLGRCSLALRLPQLLLGCLMLLISLDMGKRLFPEKPLLLTGLLAVSPYYIMVSRWGLDANIAPPLIYAGLYFLLKSTEEHSFLYAAAIFFGLSLYGYSLTWLVLPPTLALWGIYMLWTGKLRFRELLLPGLLLFALALPHILFLLVNKGIIPEIKTAFFSVPKLVYMRDGEISIKNLFSLQRWKALFTMLLRQNDGLIFNATKPFGMFYHISLPFAAAGAVSLCRQALRALKRREYSHSTLIVSGGLCALLSCLMLSSVNINRSNYLHIYTLISIAAGIKAALALCGNRRAVSAFIAAAYALCLVLFVCHCAGPYRQQLAGMFRAGLGEALDYAAEQEAELVFIDEGIYYPQVLFYSGTDPQEYATTVSYRNYPAPWLDVESFEGFRFGFDGPRDVPGAVYVLYGDDRAAFSEAGFELRDFGSVSVAVERG